MAQSHRQFTLTFPIIPRKIPTSTTAQFINNKDPEFVIPHKVNDGVNSRVQGDTQTVNEDVGIIVVCGAVQTARSQDTLPDMYHTEGDVEQTE